MYRTIHWLTALLLTLFCSLSSPALAQTSEDDRQARALFEAGVAAHESGRYEEALGYFQRAHDLSGRPKLLFNIGSTLDFLQREEEALEAFDQYLRAVPDADNREAVESRIALLHKSLRERQARKAAPSPAQAARSEADADSRRPLAQPSSQRDQDASTTRRKRRWLWSVAGVLVAGGAATAAVLLTRSDDPPTPVVRGSLGDATALTLAR